MSIYRSDIDGLRAIAVLAVVAFHSGVTGFSGGFTGVDIFFVISGYLITHILIREMNEGRYTLIGFYERRARRILPALVVVVVVCLGVGFFLLAPHQYLLTGEAARNVATFTANVYFSKVKADYWGQSLLTDQPLLHIWSLAVEEQFYLILPVLLWLIHLVASNKTQTFKIKHLYILFFLFPIMLASISYAEALLKISPGSSFYLMVPRAWELLMGSILATWFDQKPNPKLTWLRDIAGLVGIGMVILSFALLNETMPFPGAAALLPCVGAFLIIGSGCLGHGPLQRLLSLKPLTWVGKTSYSLYLWHWPVLVFVNSIGWYGWGLPYIPLSFQFVLMMLLAWISWQFIEQPFRKGEASFWLNRRILTTSVVTLALIWTSGFIAEGIATDGWPAKQPTPYIVNQFERDLAATPGSRCEGSNDLERIRLDGGGCLLGKADSQPIFALLGDSHARMYTEAIDLLAKKYDVNALVMARSSCTPLLNVKPISRPECVKLTQASLDYIRDSDIKLVVIAGYWIDIFNENSNYLHFQKELDDTLSYLRDAGKIVVLLEDIPQLSNDIEPRKSALRSLQADGAPIYGLTLSEHKRIQAPVETVIEALAAKHGAQILDPSSLICADEKNCLIAVNGRTLYRDKHHLNDAGVILLRDLFSPLFDGSIIR